MSNSRLFDLYDPKHGKVGDICKTLGYGSERKGPPRSKHLLGNKVAKFRKAFLDATPGMNLFPLEYHSPKVQLCASNFLKEMSYLFGDSEEAQAFGWPIYSRDNEKLIENLAKLMCTQEYFYRRNANNAESIRQKRPLEENDDSAPDESDSELSEAVERSSSPAFSVDSTQEERSSINDEKIRENIEIHFDFIYPLDGNEESKSSHWLLNSERWPDDAKRFTFRYLHEHNIYSKRKENFSAVALFAQKLKRHLGIECNEAGDVIIQRRCGRQITYLGGKWREYGFLEEIDRVLRKTKEFEAAWRDRRKQWIDLVHNGDPNGVIELETSLRSVAEDDAGSSRARVRKQPIYDVPSRDAQAGSATKRARVENIEDIFSGPHSASEADHSFSTGYDLHEPMSLEAEVIREPRYAPEAPMLIPGAAHAHGSAKEVQEEDQHHDNTARPSSLPAKTSSNTNQVPPSPPASVSARSIATLDERLDMLPPLEHRRSPYALSGASLNLPFNADSALVRSTHVGTPGKATKPKLHFILPNSRGSLDRVDTLPRKTFQACNISEFFRVVAARAGKSDSSLTCLTFTYNWAPEEPFVINRFESDHYWEEIKERVQDTFLKIRNSMKKRTRFELWVECGDSTNLDEVEKDDDDW